jgi:flagellin-like protein
MKSFRRNLKGISPIFATLILIAIAVIAGVVVYMFTSGTLATMTGGGTAATEKVSVQGATVTAGGAATGVVTVYAQSTNNVAVTVTSIIIRDAGGNTVLTVTPTTVGNYVTAIPNTGALVQVGGTTYTLTGVTTGNTYSVTLVTTKGGSFTSSTVIAG